MLEIHLANRLQPLLQQLVQLLDGPRQQPLQPDLVIVPSAALQRLATLHTAQALGVAAHLRFDWLAPWLWQQAGRLLPLLREAGHIAPPPRAPGPPAAPWGDARPPGSGPGPGPGPGPGDATDPPAEPSPAIALPADELAWRILAELDDSRFTAAHPRLAHWQAQTRADDDGVARWQLARRIAQVLEQLLQWRPDWAQAWLDAPDAASAAALAAAGSRAVYRPTARRHPADARRAADRPPGEPRTRAHPEDPDDPDDPDDLDDPGLPPPGTGRDGAPAAALRQPWAPGSVQAADAAWQAALLHRLAGGQPHALLAVAQALQALDDATLARLLAEATVRSGPWPERLALLALPSIPPLHLALLKQLARALPVQLLVPDPCEGFWFDLVSPRRQAWLAARGQAQHQAVGHRLLSTWGRQAQAQLALLVDAADDLAGGGATLETHFEPHPGQHRLARLQNSLLAMDDPGADADADVDVDPDTAAAGGAHPAGGPDAGPATDPATGPADTPPDRSIELHVCHSRLRELEVLHDRLLGLFDSLPGLQPGQVLVLTPDLQADTPLIDAVFGTAPRPRHIPYTITGRALASVNAPARALMDLLALLDSRLLAADLLALLQQPVVARRFGLDEAALADLHGWMAESGMRWGLDAAHQRAWGGPADGRHSLADGLARLYLGHVLPDTVPAPLPVTPDGLLPAAGIEGSRAQDLAALWQAVQALAALQRRCSAPPAAPDPHTPRWGSPAFWRETLLQALASFVAPADDEREALRELQQTIHGLADQWQRAGLDGSAGPAAAAPTAADDGPGSTPPAPPAPATSPAAAPAATPLTGDPASAAPRPLPLALVRAALQAQLDDAVRGGVPSGAVTFSAFSSLRHVPCRVLCLIGLDDGRFPSTQRPLEFDLIAAAPRAGDRQRRDDERNLFLDLLLQPTDVLHLSHVGRDARDNSERPPSVLVDELLDWLAEADARAHGDTRPAAQQAARRRLVVQHPLQPFDPRAFGADADPRLASHQAEWAAALRSAWQARHDGESAQAADTAGPTDTPPTTPPTAAGAPPAGDAADHLTDNRADGEEPDEDGEGGEGGEGEEPAEWIDHRAPPFLPAALPAAGPEWQQVSLAQWCGFFRNPARALLRGRLGLQLDEPDEPLAPDEPFSADGLARHALAERLLPPLLQGLPAAQAEALARAGLELPGGVIGQRQREAELQALQRHAQAVRAAWRQPPLPPLPVRLAAEAGGRRWLLAGALAGVRPDGLVRERFGRTRAQDLLLAWQQHLLLGLAAPPGVALRSTLLLRDRSVHFRPCDDPAAQIQGLLALYAAGLDAPLPFMPRSAWAWVGGPRVLDGRQQGTRDPDTGLPAQHLRDALPEWQGRAFGGAAGGPLPEGADPWVALAQRGWPDLLTDPGRQARFHDTAHAVFGPLIAHLERA